MADKKAKTPEVKKTGKGFKGFCQKVGHGLKEICRKFIVMLKRRPSYIPLALFLAAFIVYSFNLTDISNTTALLGGPNMGLAGFATMLFSMLSLLCFLNAFPYRKKTNVPMLCLMLAMVALIIFCDVYYIRQIAAMVSAANGTIDPYDPKTDFIAYADYYLRQHIILLCVGVVLTALLPVFKKLLRMINTNVAVEGNGEIGAIDISAE